MVENKNIELVLGSQIVDFLIKKNLDFKSTDNEVLCDRIVIKFERSSIIINPIVESDEVDVSIIDNEDELFLAMEHLDQFHGKRVCQIWYTENFNGYNDLFILGLDNIQPGVLILSEGTVLKIFLTTHL